MAWQTQPLLEEQPARDHSIRSLVLSNGERFSLIISDDGRPLFDTAVYSVSILRAQNRAANTIANRLRSLELLCTYMSHARIDLETRLEDGSLLSMEEVEELTQLCRLPMAAVRKALPDLRPGQMRLLRKQREQMRFKLGNAQVEQVSPATVASRLQTIRAYIEWFVSVRATRYAGTEPIVSRLEAALKFVVHAINARTPSDGLSFASGQPREGLEGNSISELLRVIHPTSSDNPWKDEHARNRNWVAIQWLLHLGLRRGELLAVRVPDIDFGQGKVSIIRRPDNPKDPRKFQPTLKTRERVLPIDDELLDATRDYVLQVRAKVRGARKHDFLFVASVTGAPLSLVALNKVFTVLRKKAPTLPSALVPHVLRHTWNDNYSEEMDRNKTPEEDEKKTRSYLMGWSETSNTAAIYTRRHIRKKAQNASLAMQRRLIKAPPESH